MKPRFAVNLSLSPIVTVWLLIFLTTGCIHNKGIRLSEVTNKDIKIVPVRSQPITVMSENLALVVVGTVGGGLGGGLAANAANQGATANKRATLTGRLNADAGEFKPEIILAEESEKLLKTTTRPQFRSLTRHSEPLDLPGRSELIGDETQPFKSKNPKAFDWHLRVRDWLRTPPSPEYAQAASENHATVTVESLFPVVRLINAKKVEMDVAIRVVDSTQRKILGSRYTMTRQKITPITPDSDFKVFAEDFRRCAHEAIRQCLKELRLLQTSR